MYLTLYSLHCAVNEIMLSRVGWRWIWRGCSWLWPSELWRHGYQHVGRTYRFHPRDWLVTTFKCTWRHDPEVQRWHLGSDNSKTQIPVLCFDLLIPVLFLTLFSLLIFLAYYPKMKVVLSNHQYVCVRVCVSYVSPTNNFWTDRWSYMKFGRQVMPLKVTSTPHFLIP
jgi:hypothetical protein